MLGLLLTAIGMASDVLYAVTAGAVRTWLGRRPAVVARQRYLTGGIYLALGVAAALTGDRRRP